MRKEEPLCFLRKRHGPLPSKHTVVQELQKKLFRGGSKMKWMTKVIITSITIFAGLAIFVGLIYDFLNSPFRNSMSTQEVLLGLSLSAFFIILLLIFIISKLEEKRKK